MDDKNYDLFSQKGSNRAWTLDTIAIARDKILVNDFNASI